MAGARTFYGVELTTGERPELLSGDGTGGGVGVDAEIGAWVEAGCSGTSFNICRNVINWNPLALSEVMMDGKAATVCERSPPPSCMRIMAPSPANLRIRLTITLVPVVAQLRASLLQMMVVSTSRFACDSTFVLITTLGG